MRPGSPILSPITPLKLRITTAFPLRPPAPRRSRRLPRASPEGAGTPGQVLLCLIERVGDAERQVGYLWYKPDAKMRSAFICDFYIHPDSQGKGLGKRAMAALENALRQQGFAQIKLRVAGDNARARRLYEASGFGVTGINMSKNIDAG